jgi:alanine dehydrogenase
MRIGVPKEIKNNEFRVGLTPSSVTELCHHGHQVMIETQAGAGIGITDADYLQAGAKIVDTAAEIFSTAELVVKVKEPQPEECAMLRPNQILFTYLHLAADRAQTEALLASGCTAMAYETVTDDLGGLPLLAPMSEVAGRMSIQAGAHCLEKAQGGSGILLAGVPGVSPAKVTIIGGGVVGANAARIAVGMGAQVTVLDRSIRRLTELDCQFGNALQTVYATLSNIENHVLDSDLVVGAVLIPGATAPKLVSHETVKKMRPGSVLVDVAIDQGGCFATSRPTTHKDPTYTVDGVTHYCVTNMPGAVPKTSTFALNNATLPFILLIANLGPFAAMKQNKHLANSLNIHAGQLIYQAVADAFTLPCTPKEQIL